MTSFISHLTLSLLSAFGLPASVLPETEPDRHTVQVRVESVVGDVSPLLMGFNTIYSHEKDALWKDGKGVVPTLLQSIGTRILRYPGGTVTTFYHWENPTGQGWADSWSDSFNVAGNSPPAEWMDIDEYLSITEKMEVEPLVGINMGSGKKHNRVDEGIAEAVRLVKHGMEKGNRVKYYYLDNEPYHETANYTYTAPEYAEQVNLYAEAMKAVNPDIRIIVNTHPNNIAYTRSLLELAGQNIDLVDIHFYWRFRAATFERWKREIEMTHTDRVPYRLQRANFKALTAAVGYPDIDLVSLEWNIGPHGAGNIAPTGTQSALMVSEQFIHLIQSGIPMACFWPIFWPGGTEWTGRMLANPTRNYTANPMHKMFGMFTPIMGHKQVGIQSDSEGLVQLAVKSNDGNTLWVYLVNKMQEDDEPTVEFVLDGFHATSYTVERFTADEQGAVSLPISKIEQILAPGSPVELAVPRYSFSKITFKR